jgi:hypothetical protein
VINFTTFNRDDYPPEVQPFLDDITYIDSEEFRRPIKLMKASPQHLFEGIAKLHRGVDRLVIWLGSEGYTKTWNGPNCGFVVNP